jgi:hypothetical protein
MIRSYVHLHGPGDDGGFEEYRDPHYGRKVILIAVAVIGLLAAASVFIIYPPPIF